MKYIVIDSNDAFAKALLNEITSNKGNELPQDCKFFSIAPELNTFTDEVKVEINPETVLFLNCEPAVPGRHRQDFVGIEILKWLRLKGVNNHCVMYSFLSIKAILKHHPKYLMVASSGTSFVRLPDDFKRMTSLVHQKRLEVAVEDSSRETLKATFDNSLFRHRFANIWGLLRLIEVYTEFSKTSTFWPEIDTETQSSLDFQMAKYLFNNSLAENHQISKQKEDRISEALKKLNEMDGVMRGENKLNRVILIDDKADFGWGKFLQMLMPKIIIERLPISADFNKLESAFVNCYSEDKDIMVILDLRLLPNEENENDYTKLLSVRLFWKMLNMRKNERLVYQNLKFILFTASNQLKNMLDVMYSNDTTPFRIFIKEGFDINQSTGQKYTSFLNLLDCINSAVTTSGRGKPKRLESFQKNEQKKIDGFNANLNNGNWQRAHDSLIQEYNLTRFSHIILDTNIFACEAPVPVLSSDLNIVLIYPVYKELARWTTTHEQTYRKFCANYFLELFDTKVEKKSLFNKIGEIDQKFNDPKFDLGDAADDYFSVSIEYFSKLHDSQVLFITNDKTGKKGKKSPLEIVQRWIYQNRITNVKVYYYDFRQNKLLDGESLFPKEVSPVNNTKIGAIKNTSLVNQTTLQTKKAIIKWKDCTFDKSTSTLHCSWEKGNVSSKIFGAIAMEFEGKFERLKSSEQTFTIDLETKRIVSFPKILAKIT